MKEIDFERFLEDRHREQYSGPEINRLDYFEEWMDDLDISVICRYANRFAAESIADWANFFNPEVRNG